MRRRKFVSASGATMLSLVLSPSSAQTGLRNVRIGYLAPTRIPHLVEAFVGGLRDLGYVEGLNLSLEFRFAGEEPQRFRPTRHRACEACTRSNRDCRDTCNTGGEEGDFEHSYRGRNGGRPCAQRCGPEPREARGKCHRRDALLG